MAPERRNASFILRSRISGLHFFLITTLSLINGFKVFREAYLIAGDYPEEHIYLLQHLFNNWFRDLSVNKLAAGAIVTGIVLFILIMIFQKLFDREEA